MQSKTIEIMVGLFILAGIIALVLLAFKVSGVDHLVSKQYYVVTANFDNIGGLKTNAPVSMAGVTIGQVEEINLDSQTLQATVTMVIDQKYKDIPADSSAGILTQGLLGSNYIGLTPGFDSDHVLKPGSEIVTTHSAVILETLIGQFLFNMKGDKDNTDDVSTGTAQPAV